MTMHEHLVSADNLEYGDCKLCGERKTMICAKCGYCYTCHPLAVA